MSVEVKIDVSGTIKDLKKIEVRMKNAKTLWRRLVNFLFMSWISEVFTKGGARRGHSKWKPLSPEYAAWKTSKHHRRTGGVYGPYSGKPLILYGHLQASFRLLKAEPTSMFFGTKVPYAKHHQAPKVEGRPPKREMVFITAKDKVDIGKITSSWLVEKL